MLDIKTIHEEIEKLENCEYTNWNVCNKLAILYTIKNNFNTSSSVVSASVRPVTAPAQKEMI